MTDLNKFRTVVPGKAADATAHASTETSSAASSLLVDVFGAFHNCDAAAVEKLIQTNAPFSIDEAIVNFPNRPNYEVLADVTPRLVATLLNDLPTRRQLVYVAELDNRTVAAALSEMAPDQANDLLQAMDAQRRRFLMSLLPKSVTAEIESISSYGTAELGALINPAYLSVEPSATSGDIVTMLRATSEIRFDTDTIFVCDNKGKPLGAIELTEVIRRLDDDAPVHTYMVTDLITVAATDHIRSGLLPSEKSAVTLLPVCDDEGKLFGVISQTDLIEANTRLEAGVLTRFGGSLMDSNLDYFTSPFRTLFFTRVFWLVLLTLFGVVTSTFVASQEDLLAEVIILAAFIAPIIDMGGNAGSQSATLVLRSMALGQVRVGWRELGRIISRELPVGIAIALTVTAVEVIMAVLSKGSQIFAAGTDTGGRILLVVALSMGTCTVLGAIIGGTLPFLAKRIGADPATLSSPLITSIMDILGVTIYFGFAVILLGNLG